MSFKRGLRFRIALSFFFFGILLSVMIAVGVSISVEDIEQQLMAESLQAELDHFIAQNEHPLGTVDHISARIIRYYVTPAQYSMLPDFAQKLSMGTHQLDLPQGLYYALVAPLDNGIVVLIRDASPYEQREKAIRVALTATVIVAGLVALWIGVWLSGKVISPVSNLARQVSLLQPNRRTSPRIAVNYAHDEVGQLAETFDRYLEQLERFIEREQAFTADASHELRTPLSVIKGAAELLMENPDLSERAHRQVERIFRAATRMSQMVETLLLLARDHGDEVIESESSPVHEVAQEVVEQQHFLIEGKPVVLRAQIDAEYEIPASRAVLSIVMGNLVRNAVAYTESGEVVVAVMPGCIEISDTGVGIAHEDLVHIFDRYYRGETAVAGSGIGLSIVKRICDRQGWNITIESEPGQGTVVRVKFE